MVVAEPPVAMASIMHTTAATRRSTGLRLDSQPEVCLRTMDSTPAGIKAKHMDVSVVHVLAFLTEVTCYVRQQPPAS
jgi:hypothetical protein